MYENKVNLFILNGVIMQLLRFMGHLNLFPMFTPKLISKTLKYCKKINYMVIVGFNDVYDIVYPNHTDAIW